MSGSMLTVTGQPGFLEAWLRRVTDRFAVTTHVHFMPPGSDDGSRPVERIEAVLGGLEDALHAAVAGGARFILVSPESVLGRPVGSPSAEDSNLVYGGSDHVFWESGALAAYAEQLTYAWGERYALKATIARCFSPYGEGQRASCQWSPIGQWIDQALQGQTLSMPEGHDRVRCPTNAADITTAIVLAAGSDAAVAEVLNVGSADVVTDESLARMIWRLAGRDGSPPEDAPTPSNLPMTRVPSLAKTKALLGFEARVPLDEGLRACLRASR